MIKQTALHSYYAVHGIKWNDAHNELNESTTLWNDGHNELNESRTLC